MTEPIHIISLGAGVQSSTMALMAAAGEITPMPTAAIFADTMDEPYEVYNYLKFLEKSLPFPVFRVGLGHPLSVGMFVDGACESNRNASGGGVVSIPAFKKDGGKQLRTCTKYYKLLPIRKKAREISEGKQVKMWIGISTDEVSRAKDSGVKWCENIWPLLDLRMSRQNCLSWMRYKKFPMPPKSACIYCPYHKNSQWRAFKENTEYWARILAIDSQLNRKGEFLHPGCKPMSEVDLSTEEERGQLNMFNNECEGMCGV